MNLDFQTLTQLLGISCFVLLVLGVSTLCLTEDEIEKEESIEPNIVGTYSKEELALAQYLHEKQAIQEAYLLAQNQLLKEINRS